MARELPLTRGLVAIVDDEDWALVSSQRWHAVPVGQAPQRWYAQGTRRSPEGAVGTVYLHRVILGAPKGVSVDHINNDGLDNRRANLRLCTTAENNRNKAPISACGYRGVSLRHRRRRRALPWCARIVRDGRTIRLGNFATAEEAALAYDWHVLADGDTFTRLNFPDRALETSAAPRPVPAPSLIINAARENATGYRGVRCTKSGKFIARARRRGRVLESASHRTAGDAARAYDAFALELWGDHAVLNFPCARAA